MDVQLLKEFIKPELIVLIPVLYVLGMGIKKSKIRDKFIPTILIIVAIILSGLYTFGSSDITNVKEVAMAIYTSLIQGILTAGTTVCYDQIIKQNKKDE